jgi:hypothetical protein
VQRFAWTPEREESRYEAPGGRAPGAVTEAPRILLCFFASARQRVDGEAPGEAAAGGQRHAGASIERHGGLVEAADPRERVTLGLPAVHVAVVEHARAVARFERFVRVGSRLTPRGYPTYRESSLRRWPC